MKYFTLLLIVLLLGCGDKSVRANHIREARALCPAGLNKIIATESAPEFVNCGYKCSKYTGYSSYSVEVQCVDGTELTKKWKE